MDTSYFNLSFSFGSLPFPNKNNNNNELFNNIKKHIESIKILHNNKKLLEQYQFAPYFLYSLHKQQHPNIKMQEDYNKLHYHYKYHHIQTHGVPYGIILAHFDGKHFAKSFDKNLIKENSNY